MVTPGFREANRYFTVNKHKDERNRDDLVHCEQPSPKWIQFLGPPLTSFDLERPNLAQSLFARSWQHSLAF